jgi:hypothetical protein
MSLPVEQFAGSLRHCDLPGRVLWPDVSGDGRGRPRRRCGSNAGNAADRMRSCSRIGHNVFRPRHSGPPAWSIGAFRQESGHPHSEERCTCRDRALIPEWSRVISAWPPGSRRGWRKAIADGIVGWTAHRRGPPTRYRTSLIIAPIGGAADVRPAPAVPHPTGFISPVTPPRAGDADEEDLSVESVEPVIVEPVESQRRTGPPFAREQACNSAQWRSCER